MEELMIRNRFFGAATALALLAGVSACDDPTGPVDNEQELITDVTITLTPVGGGTAMVSTIADPDGPGPLSPTAQTAALTLTPGMTYDGMIQFFDRSDPADVEDITAEVEEEADEHRVFYTLAGLTGVTVPDDSLDEDSMGSPLGLSFQVVVESGASGTGTIRVVLSHYDDAPKGDGSTPSDETDADVSFNVSVS